MYALWNTETGKWVVLPQDDHIRVFTTYSNAYATLRNWVNAPNSVRVYAVTLQYDSSRPSPFNEFPHENKE